MYFYDKSEPIRTCREVIHLLTQERAKVLKELKEMNMPKFVEHSNKIEEIDFSKQLESFNKKAKLQWKYKHYSEIIYSLENIVTYLLEKIKKDYPGIPIY